MNRALAGSRGSTYERFIQSTRDLLESYNVLNGGGFESSEWVFLSPYTDTEISVDFKSFELFEVNLKFRIQIVFEGSKLSLTTGGLAKILWLNLLDSSAGVGYHNARALDVIALIFAFINEYQVERIDERNLTDLYIFMLSHQVDEQGITRRFSAPTHHEISSHAPLSELSRILKSYGVKGILGSFSREKEVKALDEACRLQLGMTLSDYKKGESLNFLGLDIGKHYIDHCGNIFEEHFQYAFAVRKSLEGIFERVKINLGAHCDRELILQAAANVLLGGTLESIKIKFGSIWKSRTFDVIYRTTRDFFRENYNGAADLASAFQLDTVNEIIADCGLPDRFDAQEFVRSFLFALYIDSQFKLSKSIYSEYFSALRHGEEAPDVQFNDFQEKCASVIRRRRRELSDNTEQVRSFCLTQSERLGWYSDQDGVRRLKACATLVESCGTTLVVGLLGWRRSEFGFPLNSIGIQINHDVLDNLYTPLRFHVNWVVPKTSGGTPLNREITLYAYLTAYLLDKLNLAYGERPALYIAGETLEKGSRFFDSAPQVARRVEIGWPDFVRNYSIFDDIDTFQLLLEKAKNENLDKVERKVLLQLQSRFEDRSEELDSLIEMRNSLLRDLPKYILCNSAAAPLADKIVEYVTETLDHETTRLIDSALPDDIRAKLKSFDYDVSSIDILRIRSFILQDIVFPTPHAFRHIWAEAVLRRYRGDVGKFIRANFKHLDESFFMAYLRDKETKAVYEVAKRAVINGIVRQQISALARNDRQFAGGFDRFLSRAISSTNVVSPEQFEMLADKISHERVIDIKANAWSTCMLRVGTEKIAKCSVDGTPQRQNAEPRLCLGCINACISEGNFNGIVVYIKADIDACRNPKLPAFIKELHLPVVKLALSRVRQLSRNGEIAKYQVFIKHLEDTITLCENSMRAPKVVGKK